MMKFGPFEFDAVAGLVYRGEEETLLPPKPAGVLKVLLEHSGELVTKDELLDSVWGDSHVSEGSLTDAVSLLRQVLGDDPRHPTYIQTFHRRGYRFIAEVVSRGIPSGTSSSRNSRRVVGSDISEAQPSIAVLPFADMSPAKDQDYFCEGMAEEIINALAKIDGLSVASRSAAFQFKGPAHDIRGVGESLNVDTVLEGSVRTAGERLRITTQLVNVEDGYHRWSERFDRQREDILDIQDEISESVAAALRVRLVGSREPAQRRHSSNIEAYHLYLKGQHNWYRREKDSLQKAARFFEAAASEDPSYALAHTGVANAYTSLAYYGLQRDIAYPKAKAAVEKARSINADLTEVHAAAGMMRFWLEWDWDGSERSFKRSISIDPEYVLVRSWYSFLLDALRRHDEALEMAESARNLDPLSAYANTSLGFCLLRRGEYEEAVRAAEMALEMEPDFLYAHWVLGGAYSLGSRHDEAISVLERAVTLSGRASYYLSWLARACGAAGDKTRAMTIIGELEDRSRTDFVPAAFLAWAYAGLPDPQQTFAWLERAFAERGSQLNITGANPLLDSVSSDARFSRLLDRMRLPGSTR
jgi:TolB-like protein/Tfp pilus assembly protein PilF